MDKRHVRLKNSFLWLLIAVVFILLPVLFFVNFYPYYLYRFDAYAVYSDFSNIGIPKSSVDSNLVLLIKSFSPLNRPLNHEFYSSEDLLHLRDVRNIINFFYVLFVFCLGLLIINFKNLKTAALSLIKYSRFYIAASILINLVIVINFSYFFEVGHKIVFFNDYWLLDPSTSNLIKFFPEMLFLELYVLIIIFNLLLHFSFIMLVRYFYGKNSK